MVIAAFLPRAAAKCALILAMAQSAGCASPYALPPSVTTAVGEQPKLVCEAGEVQLCRDHGHALKCTCSPF